MEFLLELLTEELPASHIRSALGQIEAGFRKELAAARIEIVSLRTLATPRRLIVVADLLGDLWYRLTPERRACLLYTSPSPRD